MLSLTYACRRYLWVIVFGSILYVGPSDLQRRCCYAGKPGANAWANAPCVEGRCSPTSAGVGMYAPDSRPGIDGHNRCGPPCCRMRHWRCIGLLKWLRPARYDGADEATISPPHSRFHPVPTHPVFSPLPVFTAPPGLDASRSTGAGTESDAQPLAAEGRSRVSNHYPPVRQASFADASAHSSFPPSAGAPLSSPPLQLAKPANQLRVVGLRRDVGGNVGRK
jgi:hypothetical protein